MARNGVPRAILAAMQALAARYDGPSVALEAPAERPGMLDNVVSRMLVAGLTPNHSSGYARGLWPGRMPGGQSSKWGRPSKNGRAHQSAREMTRRRRQMENK